VTVQLEKYGFSSSRDQLKTSAHEMLNLMVKLPLSPNFSLLSLSSTPEGAHLLVNDVDTGLTTPISEHVLRANQSYRVTLTLAGHLPWETTIAPTSGKHLKQSVPLSTGSLITISANVRGHIFIGKTKQTLPLTDYLMAPGTYRLRLVNKELNLDHPFIAQLEHDRPFKRHLLFGFVSTDKKEFRIKLDNRTTTSTVALLPGQQRLILVNLKNGKTREEMVNVVANKTIVLE
jgi:hypothetical protein